MQINLDTPKWARPLLAHARYKGSHGGRGSGKSHQFATFVVAAMCADPNLSVVCVREVQKSLELSAKKLIEAKIESMGVAHLFEVQKAVIKRRGGTGICIFQGLQDHTADSIKSLEGFGLCWIEEAQSITEHSLNLLRPTIRADHGPFGAPSAEIWATWNPRRRSDAIEKLLRPRGRTAENSIVVRANYTDNPFLPATLLAEAESDKINNPDNFAHVWLGDYESMGSKVVIPSLWVDAAIGLDIDPTGRAFGALDVAGADDGGDENACATRRGSTLIGLDKWNGLDGELTLRKAMGIWRDLGSDENFYDSAGVGESVLTAWAGMGRRKEQPSGMRLTAWNGGMSVTNPDDRIDPRNPRAPRNKDHYHNLKAQAWFSLRARFENAYKKSMGREYDATHIISLPADLPYLEQLQDELSQPHKKESGTGKVMVDKQPDDAQSPNLADAVVMAYFPLASKASILDAL